MATRYRLALLGLASLGLVGFLPPTCGVLVARLSGDQVVPPVDTRARGEAFFSYTNEPLPLAAPGQLPILSFTLGARGLAGVTGAHVHCGSEGTKGPVAALLYGLDGEGTTLTGLHVEGAIREGDVLDVDDSAACPGGVHGIADLAVKMKTGGAYVNVHSEAYPDGELRGTIVEVLRGLRRPIQCGPNRLVTCNPRTEICVRREPVGPASVFACEPVPDGCQGERTCSCAGESLCTGAFGVCHDVPEPDTILCECPQCQ
jgi:hypothetical protein